MKELENEVDSFVEAIKNTKTYKNFNKTLTALKKDPELKRKVDEYRKERYDIQNSDYYDEQAADNFTEKYADFIEQPVVGDFLDAENDLCRMLQAITDKVIDSVNFE